LTAFGHTMLVMSTLSGPRWAAGVRIRPGRARFVGTPWTVIGPIDAALRALSTEDAGALPPAYPTPGRRDAAL